MSYVIATPEMMATAAFDLARIGSQVSAASAVAAMPTTEVVAAGADEVSAGIAALFSAHAQEYQALSAQAAALCYGAAGVAMGTRFLLTSDSTVPDAVKRRYLQAGLDGTVVTTRVDGMPHRVLRTELVEKLESGSRARGFAAALRNAGKFRRMSQMTWRSMIRDGLTMRHGKELTWSQVLMAANTPMLLKAGLVDGNTEAGVLASGQVAGILDDLPSCKELIESIVLDAITHLQTASALVE